MVNHAENTLFAIIGECTLTSQLIELDWSIDQLRQTSNVQCHWLNISMAKY